MNNNQNKQIQALHQFRKAYINLLEHWEHNETDLSDLKSISHYPFENSFDEYNIIEWTLQAEKEINQLHKQKQHTHFLKLIETLTLNEYDYTIKNNCFYMILGNEEYLFSIDNEEEAKNLLKTIKQHF